MALSTKYDPVSVEGKWYQHWMDQKFFRSTPNPDKQPYTIVIPPPNVTGVLHMGHMLNNTIQDVLIRKARMEGREACWVPGTDHASIATEAKVVAMLKERGIGKKDISREEFVNYAKEWKEKYGGIILQQLKHLGASCDWDRTRYTMEESLSNSVIEVFNRLYDKGLIYRGIRMVNWDPAGKTALSDDEVIHKEIQSKLYYVHYQIEGEDDTLTIATTRPETILGDTAVCVHPDDERYKHLHGKRALVPLINRSVPIITDEYVSMEFGTGCLKITPAHDLNDYELGQKHGLESIDILNDDGTLNEKAGLFPGEDRFVVRKKIAVELEKAGQLVKVEDYTNNVGFSERTDAVIEPRLSMQWFVKMDEITKPAYRHVMDDTVRLIPPKFKNTYRHWMENVRDWCISRQLWWGHQIPAWYLPDNSIVVALNAEEALQKAREKDDSLTMDDLRQDEDVLDTWFSSWLWPITVFDGLEDPGNEDIRYYYPTNDLVTAPEILFFWVARMIIAGYEFMGEKPFSNVYLTGIVRDKQGRKMSKSLGNSPDPLELIRQYGADGVRTGMLFSSPAGNDLLFDIKLCEQGRNFANKIWNAYRLMDGWQVDDALDTDENAVAIRWFEAKLHATQEEMEDHFTKFRISDALMSAYKLTWNDFCSWYLEMVKPGFEQPVDRKTYEATRDFFEILMKLLHPFMPFLTEELWHELRERDEKDCVIVADWPQHGPYDASLLRSGDVAFELISHVRNFRNSKQISPKEPLKLFVQTEHFDAYIPFAGVIRKLANLSTFESVEQAVENASSFVLQGDSFFIPTDGAIDTEKELEELHKELEYTRGFLQGVRKKLENDRFVNNAPAQVVDMERKKQADAEAKISALEERIGSLT